MAQGVSDLTFVASCILAGIRAGAEVALQMLDAEQGVFSAEDECQHPDDQLEPMKGSTMGNLTYRCRACGKEGIRREHTNYQSTAGVR